nr:hypothetical protein [Treponema sp.]
MKNSSLRLCSAFFFLSFLFASCSDDFWEYPSKSFDSSLTVRISQTDNGDGTASVNFRINGNATGVIYTIDGNSPSVEYSDSSSDHISYFGYKYTGSSAVVVKGDCTLKAMAYKVDTSLETVRYGNVTSAEIDVEDVVTYQFLYESEILQTSSEFTFRSGPFEYVYDGVSYPDSKYKLEFKKDGEGSGTWELYVYHNGNLLPDSKNGHNYIAKGIFSGTSFDTLPPTTGNVYLKTLNGKHLATVSLKYDSEDDLVFDLPISKSFIEKVTADY